CARPGTRWRREFRDVPVHGYHGCDAVQLIVPVRQLCRGHRDCGVARRASPAEHGRPRDAHVLKPRPAAVRRTPMSPDSDTERTGERGQMLVLFTLCLVVVIALTGLVLDGGDTFLARRDLQNIADTSAMAGAYSYV